MVLVEIEGEGDRARLGGDDPHAAPSIEGRPLDERGEVLGRVRHRASLSRGSGPAGMGQRPAGHVRAPRYDGRREPMAHVHEELARIALAEDAPSGDLTSRATIPEGTSCDAELVVKQDGVLAGLEAAVAVFELAAAAGRHRRADRPQGRLTAITFGPATASRCSVGDARTVLRAERPALNLLGHLSGIATLTRAYVEAAAPAAILCTRKTLPGLRAVEREAVAAGGGTLHRASLSDAILIKDTHVRIAGGVTEAIRRAHVRRPYRSRSRSRRSSNSTRRSRSGPSGSCSTTRRPTACAGRSRGRRPGTPGDLRAASIWRTYARSSTPAPASLSVGRLTHSAPRSDLSLEVIGTRCLRRTRRCRSRRGRPRSIASPRNATP